MRSVLFCGFGWASRRLWLPALEAAGFTEFGVLDEHVPARDLETAGATRAHHSPEELRPGQYDVAVVASPNVTHADVARIPLERGIPTVVEKPVCVDLAGLETLRDAAARGGSRVLRSWSTRYDPHVARFLEHVRSEGPARLDRVSVSWVRESGVPGSPWLTRAEHAAAGSSVDLGWHLLECALALTGYGPVELLSASFEHLGPGAGGAGHVASWHGRPDGPTEVDVDTGSRLSLVSGGTAIDLRTAWRSEGPGDTVTIEVMGPGFRSRLTTILGMSDALVREPVIETARDGGVTRTALDPKPRGTAHALMVADFVARGFDPVLLGQSWEQLEVLTSAASAVVEAHGRWRAVVHAGVS
ncbi:Gfo/Idh/MocA family protein [Isoptericola sp. G70]|uniref:Gfo/Idh/MocA family protein n=1 Tax=Isoptericola sp. G70 TaxID=3376633 RepID=UPI003A80ED18